MAVKLTNSMRSVMADIVAAYLSGTGGTMGTAGLLKVYGGTQPGTAGGTAGTQEILVQISSIAWNASTNGTAAISASKTGTSGTSGTSTWARLSDSTGTAYIIDGVCGTAAASDFVIDAASIVATAVITLSAATIIQPGS